MGLDIKGTRALLYANKEGANFSRTAMIGRQELHLNGAALALNLRDFGFSAAAKDAAHLLSEERGYAEPFLRVLGASEIVSFDASDFEGASCIHDFNLPIDKNLFQSFSVVLECGSLEHIFNFPQAISNCMEMVKVGGTFISITPTNNFLGHGFYQFSPEVFFRIFSPDNGFELRRMLAYESGTDDWYDVVDPRVIGERGTLINRRETYLCVIAKRTAAVPIFANGIQQSDYSAQWRNGLARHASPRSAAGWRSHVPARLILSLQALRGWFPPRGGFNARYFKKIHIP